MLSIGLTGGIGSGKSTVARIFETLGIPVYYADTEAKRLMETDDRIRSQIIATFGEASYSGDQLNRDHLSQRVFNSQSQINILNAIVHPVTIADAGAWFHRQQTPYAIKEAALIFESNSHIALDAVIGVYAPPLLRIKRAMQRDGLSEEQVKSRMNRQMNEEEKIAKCNYVLVNDEQQLLTPQVIALHEKLLILAAEK